MSKNHKRLEAADSGHACFFYESSVDRLDVLVDYFREGLEQNELCVFVTPETVSSVKKSFREHGYNIDEAYQLGAIRIFNMNDTYLPDGRFAAKFMETNVVNFMSDAKELGYAGLRTAGEMSWLNSNRGSIPEAIAYEKAVNTLTTPDSNFTGLCLYSGENTFGDIIAGAMRTHPEFIYEGRFRSNPYYATA